jgi:phosphonate transport system substrate-binding protein
MDTQKPQSEIRNKAAARSPKGVLMKLPVLLSHSEGFASGLAAFRFRIPVWAAILVLAATLPVRSLAAGQNDADFRIGFSSSMFTEVNENDARASIKVWGQTIAKKHGVPINPDPMIIKDTPALLQALRDKEVDAVGITIIEYAAVSQEIQFAPIFLTRTGGQTREQYLLLVHQESQIDRLPDLRGKNLTFYQNARTCLAQPWLDTMLVQNAGKPAAGFVGKITQARQLSKAVLPVFFRQSDACMVTRAGFETMCELNPQIGRQLKIVARSPEVVPVLLCFRADYSSVFKEDVFASLRELHTSVPGQQVLTVFECEKIEEQPATCLESALELLACYAHLADGAGVTKAPPAGELPLSFGEINP